MATGKGKEIPTRRQKDCNSPFELRIADHKSAAVPLIILLMALHWPLDHFDDFPSLLL